MDAVFFDFLAYVAIFTVGFLFSYYLSVHLC
jgi:hypothetical protein